MSTVAFVNALIPPRDARLGDREIVIAITDAARKLGRCLLDGSDTRLR